MKSSATLKQASNSASLVAFLNCGSRLCSWTHVWCVQLHIGDIFAIKKICCTVTHTCRRDISPLWHSPCHCLWALLFDLLLTVFQSVDCALSKPLVTAAKRFMCSGEIQAVSLIEIERQMLFYFLQSSRSWRWRYQRQARLVLPWKCFCCSNAIWWPWWHSVHEIRKLHFCRSLTLLLSNVLSLPWTPVCIGCSDHLAVTFGIVDVASEGRHKAIHRSEDMTC